MNATILLGYFWVIVNRTLVCISYTALEIMSRALNPRPTPLGTLFPSVLSCRIGDSVLSVRLHRMFLSADHPVIGEIVDPQGSFLF